MRLNRNSYSRICTGCAITLGGPPAAGAERWRHDRRRQHGERHRLGRGRGRQGRRGRKDAGEKDAAHRRREIDADRRRPTPGPTRANRRGRSERDRAGAERDGPDDRRYHHTGRDDPRGSRGVVAEPFDYARRFVIGTTPTVLRPRRRRRAWIYGEGQTHPLSTSSTQTPSAASTSARRTSPATRWQP